MPKALSEIVPQQQVALQTIPLIINTPKGSKMTYVITESETDQLVYSKFVNARYTHVFTSSMIEKNGQEGCENVEHIVLQLNTSYPNKIIGIRDKDYTTFSDTYTPAVNVFYTDGRDIEMMMFECGFVQGELRKLDDFDNTYRKSVDFARQIGYLRIANDRLKLGFSFKKKLKYNILLHPRTGDAIPAEIIAFEQQFIADVGGYTALQLQQHKTELATQADKLICRGHDVVDMLANYYRTKVSKKELELILAVYYHINSFRTTTLYDDLNRWAIVYNPHLMNI